LDYYELIASVEHKKERPKIFAKQLQTSYLICNELLKAFPSAMLQRMGQKFRSIYLNMH